MYYDEHKAAYFKCFTSCLFFVVEKKNKAAITAETTTGMYTRHRYHFEAERAFRAGNTEQRRYWIGRRTRGDARRRPLSLELGVLESLIVSSSPGWANPRCCCTQRARPNCTSRIGVPRLCPRLIFLLDFAFFSESAEIGLSLSAD